MLPRISARATNVAENAQVAQRNSYHPNDGGLQLYSTLGNITSVNGQNLYSAPIKTSIYRDILANAQLDILKHHDLNDVTGFYQCNHSGWSFEVVVANGTLHYGSLSAVVSRYMKLIPSYGPAKDVTRTRVGRIDRLGKPLADVAMIPLDAQPALNNTAVSIQLEPGQVLAIEITPQGSITRAETLMGQELSIFGTQEPRNFPKRQNGLEREVVRAVSTTTFSLSIRLWRDPQGRLPILRSAAIFLLARPIYLALTNLNLILDTIEQAHSAVQSAAETMHNNTLSGIYAGLEGSELEINSGYFQFGYMSTRFLMKITERDENGNLPVLDAVTWPKLAWSILEPLKSLMVGNDSDSRQAYAVHGDIYGPRSLLLNGTGQAAQEQQQQQVVVGYWELVAMPVEA